MAVLIFAALFVVMEILCRISDRQNTLWRVAVLWEGEYVTHKARDEQEGREWLACYPVGTSGVIERVFHGRPYIVAARHA